MHSGWKPAAAALLAAASLAAVAADQTFTNQGQFQAAAGATVTESFESVAARTRSDQPVVTPLFTVTPIDTLVGVQANANTPEPGFGAAAVQGNRYLFNYNPFQPSGTLTFTLAAPATSFGFVMVDAGETDGTVVLRTNTGAYAGGVVLATFAAPFAANGTQMFFGLTQATPFTQVSVIVNGVDEAYGIDVVQVTAVPEPAQGALLLAGLGLVGAIARRRGALA